MCAITGIVGNNLREAEKTDLQRMTKRVSHRGPDADGFYYDENVFLGHRRLSIIDLSQKANQPMADFKGEVLTVFNGEIYNHKEIRAQLEKEFPFRTDHSDTETLLYAYKKWGMEFLGKINGMFAIALYDRRLQKVFLVRDRFGKKPLYYTFLGNQLYFASEIAAFLVLPGFSPKPNTQAISNYLTFLTTYPPETFFRGVYKVKASHYVEIQVTEQRPETRDIQYWNIAEALSTVSDVSYEEAKGQTEALFSKSVQLRNVSDVPLAVSLSGGVDSSLNLVFSHKTNPDVRSVNVSYRNADPALDESRYARELSERVRVDCLQIKVDDREYEEAVREFMGVFRDMPVMWPDMVLMYIISKHLRSRGIKVVLVGEGGDELGAYPQYFEILRNRQYAKILKFFPSFTRRLFPPESRIAIGLNLLHKGDLISYRHIHAFREEVKKEFWNKGEAMNSYEVLKGIMDEIDMKGAEGFIRKVLNVEYKLRLPELLLPRIDYATMANSVEARTPFLDYELVEYSMKLPFFTRNKDGAKSMIKDIASKHLPGDYPLDRPKSGFGQEFSPFFSERFHAWFTRDILEREAPVQEYIKKDFLQEMYEKNRKKGRGGYRMWVIYALNEWLRLNF